MKLNLRIFSLCSRSTLLLVLIAFLSACAHPITINPDTKPTRNEVSQSPKKVAYVMTDADRSKQVSNKTGGGDNITYFPYHDLEKTIRDALSSVYSDVIVIKSPTDKAAIQGNDLSFIFTPVIYTSSMSEDWAYWPPTYFTIDLSCDVTDQNGNVVSSFKIQGNGVAKHEEYMVDTGLSGRRAASDLFEKLKQELMKNQSLH
jgi:hypothetical protein